MTAGVVGMANPYLEGMAYAQRTGRSNTKVSAKSLDREFTLPETNKSGDTGNVLHCFDHEEGEINVGAWMDIVSGQSVSVYQPKDFDPDNPVYKIRIWDEAGNMEERDIALNDVDPKHADTFEMYAYSCYAEHTGERPNAVMDFMMTHARSHDMEQSYSKENLFDRIDWMAMLDKLMKMQYNANDMQGYLRYKGFRDFLAG